MTVGIITGSGIHALPGFTEAEPVAIDTPFGACEVTRGEYRGSGALHVSRHGAGHHRLSNHVNHRANIWALKELGARGVIGCTACGSVDAALAPGSLVVFDDLHFISNRLPGGELCTFFSEPSDPVRAHWILSGGPFAADVRAALLAAAGEAGHDARDGGVYGHVDGPRFNTPSEIAQLARCGVIAVSQTGGPETVLCGELELPYGLIGFVTDFANGVSAAAPTPVSELIALMASSSKTFADVLGAALPRIPERPATVGTVYRMQRG